MNNDPKSTLGVCDRFDVRFDGILLPDLGLRFIIDVLSTHQVVEDVMIIKQRGLILPAVGATPPGP